MSASDIACVVLASGLSKRFGAADKLSVDLCGQSVLSYVLNTANAVGFGEIFCVSLSHGIDGCTWVKNENPEAGQGHALRLGLSAARNSSWQSCIVMLGDMPLVSQVYVNRLIRKNYINQSIVSISESIRMPPALFNAAAIDMILSRKSALGARDLFDILNLATLELDTDAALDVDTPEDLTRVARIMKAREI